MGTKPYDLVKFSKMYEKDKTVKAEFFFKKSGRTNKNDPNGQEV